MTLKPLLVELERQPLGSSSDEHQKILYLHFIFRSFLCIFVMIQSKLCKIHGTEKLITNLFGITVKQPSP